MASRSFKLIPQELYNTISPLAPFEFPVLARRLSALFRFISENFGRIGTELGGVFNGRAATSHARLTGAGTDTHTITITTPNKTTIYELDNNGSVTAGNISVTIGATAALTAVALKVAIDANQGTLVSTAIGPDTDVINITSIKKGTALTLSNSGATFVVQNNGEQRDDDSISKIYTTTRTITAEDVTRTYVVINTGLTTIVNYIWKFTTSSNVVVAWNGGITVSGGTFTFDNAGATDWASTNILYLWAIGYE